MKTITSTLEAKEIASSNKGAELYRVFNSAGDIFYYTDASVSISYLGRTYVPASIKRSALEFDSTIGISRMKIQFVWSDPTIRDYIAQNPVSITWVEVLRTYLDLSPIEVRAIFIGEVKLIGFVGLQAEAECISLEHYLGAGIPIDSYQHLCNHYLYDAGCGVDKTLYKRTAIVTSFGATKNIVYSTGIVANGPNYYTYGYIVAKGTSRMIVSYTSYAQFFTLMYSIPDLEVGDSFDYYPGCDRTSYTCQYKWANKINFFGFEYIPFDNPVLWSA